MLARKRRRDLDRLFEDDHLIESALRMGVLDALRRHKEAGLPVAAWRNGKVVWVPPQEIVVDVKRSEGLKRKVRTRTAT